MLVAGWHILKNFKLLFANTVLFFLKLIVLVIKYLVLLYWMLKLQKRY